MIVTIIGFNVFAFGLSAKLMPKALELLGTWQGSAPERTYRNREATATAAPLFAGTVRHHQRRPPGFFLLVHLNGNLISNNVLPLQFSRKTLSFNAIGQSPTFY
jgi:hypothetical protein